jgi:hypothetical protein
VPGGGGSPKRDVKPPQPDIRGKRYTYGARVGRGAPIKTRATNGRGTGRRGACGGRATRGIAHTRHNIVSDETSASERRVRRVPAALRVGSGQECLLEWERRRVDDDDVTTTNLYGNRCELITGYKIFDL